MVSDTGNNMNQMTASRCFSLLLAASRQLNALSTYSRLSILAREETNQKVIFSRAIGENETSIKLLGKGGLPLNREHCAINSIVATGALAFADLAVRFRQAPHLSLGISPKRS